VSALDDKLLVLDEEDAPRKLLFSHVINGSLDGVKKVLEDTSQGLQVNDRLKSGPRSGSTLLHFCPFDVAANASESEASKALSVNRIQIAKYLLTHGSSLDLGATDASGCTALHIAAKSGYIRFNPKTTIQSCPEKNVTA